MSIAIIYMAKEFNWNHITQGHVLSSFYTDYLTTQVTGVLADKFGGRRILGIGISKEELDKILEGKSSSYSEDNFERNQSVSREYIYKIPWKIIFSRREV
ncbi:hypothetical protein C2G38_2155655 [Gigaspora rosea]|uniref:Uncharacterized protein n=1 Tax=Gigaspora rosea TaxID=44941 RepID=A0A397W3K6_9GLOM|nr:hypothetical protein C2G38_2155655 [Gigaspora rosea]